MPLRLHARYLLGAMVVVAAATVAWPLAAVAQTSGSHRLSLADRVERLEQQQAQGSIEGVNRVQQLQSQVQELLGRVQELEHQLEQFQQVSKNRYVDLDSRLRRLHGGDPAPAPGTAVPGASGPADSAQVPATPAATAAPSDAAPGALAGGGSDLLSGDPESDYQHAFSALRNGDFASASRLFQAFIQQYPSVDLTPNAYYWLGESHYGVQNYQAALRTFQRLLQRFPDDAKAPGALLKVGYSQFELKRWDQARETLEEVQQLYPDSREARLAAGRLRALGRMAGT